MDTSTLSKRTFEILDLAHDGKAVLDDGAMPPAIAGWRLEQLQAALSEAEQLARARRSESADALAIAWGRSAQERHHAQGRLVQRIAEATHEIEATITEIEETQKRRFTLHDWIGRWGIVAATAWTAVVACFVVLGSLTFAVLFAVSAGIVAVRMTEACRTAIDRRIHEESLPIRLSLAWNKLAVAENTLHRDKD